MSTYTSEPGTRLAGRYRLVDQVNAGSGWAMWKAMDETLARPVSVLTFASGFPRVAEVVTAARAASRLTDPRLAQVFDVEDSYEGAYIVMEWVAGDTLADILANGPLDAGRACAVVIDAARALAGAHGAGLPHLRLTPQSLRWTRTSGVKVVGLGIDAALAGTGLTGAAAEDPALADAQGLASLLYAALTGYWPGEEQTGLPPAPQSDGMTCTPRQVSADVPPALDVVICRAMFQRSARHDPPIVTPAVFADALADVAPPVPLPEPVPLAWAGHPPGVTSGFRANRNDPASWVTTQGGPAPYRRPEGNAAARGIIAVVVVLVIAALAAAGWMISKSLHSGTTSSAGRQTPSASRSGSAAAQSSVLKPASDSTYNLYGGGNNEDAAKAGLAIDGDPTTAWSTQWYASPKLGGLKPGTGLIIDMGRSVRLSQVEVLFSSGCCTSADVYLGNSSDISQAAFSSFTQVGSASSVSGDHKYPISGSATGRYVLVWLTSLPRALASSGVPSNTYQGLIYEVTVRGAPASAAG